jgi:hypothetical protein
MADENNTATKIPWAASASKVKTTEAQLAVIMKKEEAGRVAAGEHRRDCALDGMFRSYLQLARKDNLRSRDRDEPGFLCVRYCLLELRERRY